MTFAMVAANGPQTGLFVGAHERRLRCPYKGSSAANVRTFAGRSANEAQT